jgi:capsular exopolysaccharide synthesis family protein
VQDTEERSGQGPTLLASLWRFRFQLLAAGAVFGVLGFVVSSLQPTQYQSTAVMVLRDPGSAGVFSTDSFNSDPDRYVSQQANLVLSASVLAPAAEALGNESVESLTDAIAVESDSQLNQISVIASAAEPQAASDMANTVAETYEEVSRAQSRSDVVRANDVLEEQITTMREEVEKLDRRVRNNTNDVIAADRLRSIQNELLALETRSTEMAADAALFGSGVRQRENAQVPEEPAAPLPLRDAALSASLALVVGAAIAYWRAGLRRVIETRSDPGSVLDVPLLGEIPKFSRVGSGPSGLLPGSEASEAYEFVLSSIEFSLADIDGSSVLITSAAPGDGKTATALHLAVASARETRKVILVDTDVRVHGLTTLLRAEEHPGLVELAEGSVELDECIRRYRLSDSAQLAVVPSGEAPDDSTGLMRAPAFKRAIRSIRDAAELVILDSPPLLAVADATVLATQVDAIVLVVDSHTERDQLLKVRERLAFVQTPVIGYIYNRANIDRATKDGYAYGGAGRYTSGGRSGFSAFRSTPPKSGQEVPANGQAGRRPAPPR